LHYLKDVILARVLDDPTFNILNSLLFFNQIDIIAYFGNNDAFLRNLFAGFKGTKLAEVQTTKLDTLPPQPLNTRTRDVVAFLHQLMLMGKQVQAQHRLALYKILLERGLLYVCEWALQRPETSIINQGAEMVALILDHDLNGIRSYCLREHEAKRRTIADDISKLLVTSKDLGLKSQMSDAIRSLLDVGLDPNDVSGADQPHIGARALIQHPRLTNSLQLCERRKAAQSQTHSQHTSMITSPRPCTDLYWIFRMSKPSRVSLTLRCALT
jgi:protein phosphatase-4 regulatory subunit 3